MVARPNRRMITRAMLGALMDYHIHGWPIGIGTIINASHAGTCTVCHWPFERGELIQRKKFAGREWGWGHAVCDDWWLLLARLADTESDPRIILRESIGSGGSKCASCERIMDGETIHQERVPVPLDNPGSIRWICEKCKEGDL